jgi:hypothetical protein
MAGDSVPMALKSFSAAQPSGRTGKGREDRAAVIIKLDR